MRALLRPLATHSVFSPIEAIVSVFVLATLAYFHILTGIKHSSFFAPTFPSALRPAYARLSKGHWTNAFKAEGAIELQQIVFSLDDKAHKVCFFNNSFVPFCTCFVLSSSLVRTWECGPYSMMWCRHVRKTQPNDKHPSYTPPVILLS